MIIGIKRNKKEGLDAFPKASEETVADAVAAQTQTIITVATVIAIVTVIATVTAIAIMVNF